MICYNSGRPGHFKYCIYWHRRNNWIGRRDGWRPWVFVRAVICLPRGWLVLRPAAGVALDILCALSPQHRCFLLLPAPLAVSINNTQHSLCYCATSLEPLQSGDLRFCSSIRTTNLSNLLYIGIEHLIQLFKLHNLHSKKSVTFLRFYISTWFTNQVCTVN